MSLVQKLLDEAGALERDLIALLPGEHHNAVREAVAKLAERTKLHLGEPIAPQDVAQTVPADKVYPCTEALAVPPATPATPSALPTI